MMKELNRHTSPSVFLYVDQCIKRIKDLTGNEVDLKVFLTSEVHIKSESELLDEKIQAFVSDEFGVRWEQIKGKRRLQKIADARHVYCWLALRLLPYKSHQVAKSIGLRDHSSALHGQKKINSLIYIKDDVGLAALKLLQLLETKYRLVG